VIEAHAPECPRRGPGRPRDPQVDRAILDAVTDLLGEEGYEGLTIEGVAARARVGKTTVYRRWPTKAALVVDALAAAAESVGVFDTGDVEADLRQTVRHMADTMGKGRRADMMGGMATAIARDPELAEVFRTSFLRPRRESVKALLRRAVAEGVIRQDVDLDLLVDCLSGPICMRLLFSGGAVTPRVADHLVDLLLEGARGHGADGG
jgi:AcrR family transcriptional regulator